MMTKDRRARRGRTLMMTGVVEPTLATRLETTLIVELAREEGR